MNTAFFILTIIFIIAAVAMILIILVQRPQGGGLAGAFGRAGGSSADTVFGGRVGDALTTMTVVAFVVYLALAIFLNRVDSDTIAGVTVAGTPLDVLADEAAEAEEDALLIRFKGETGAQEARLRGGLSERQARIRADTAQAEGFQSLLGGGAAAAGTLIE